MSSYITIAPSLLAANFACIAEDVDSVAQAGADWLHLDVMDGTFVPPITFGAQFVQAVRNCTSLPLDVHLMTEHPETHFQDFAKAGASFITFHTEACVHSHRAVQHIKALGVQAGISLVPSTPVSAIVELLPFVDLVLVMTVNPGYGGQKLILSCVQKVKTLAKICKEQSLSFQISVDGGVCVDNAATIIQAGANVLVAGSAIFNTKNKKGLMEQLRNAC